MPRKKRGRGPGHPVTTGSASVPPVFYRVSEKQRAELEKAGKRRGLTGNAEAKRRAFPRTQRSPEATSARTTGATVNQALGCIAGARELLVKATERTHVLSEQLAPRSTKGTP